MIKRLVSFGCSWAHGTELLDPDLEKEGMIWCQPENDEYRKSHSFPGLVAAHYGWDLEDYSKNDNNVAGLLDQIEDYLKNIPSEKRDELIVLVSLGVVESFEEFTDILNKLEILESKFGVLIRVLNVLSLNKSKIKSSILIESSSALEMLVIRNKPRKNPLFSKYKHPNEDGHQIIAEFLTSYIDSAIVT